MRMGQADGGRPSAGTLSVVMSIAMFLGILVGDAG
jgi:hypothetical protein